MSTPKYKLNINHLETPGEIRKLERDGFTRETIIREMYKQTDGASQAYRTNMINKLYDRTKG